jgi:hypothetical protein
MKEEKKKVNIVYRDLDEAELSEKRIHLLYCELEKDRSDLSLAEMEQQMTDKVPTMFLDDDIAQLENDIKAKYVTKEKREATEADLIYMKSTLGFMKKKKKLDIPMRELRLNILKLQNAKGKQDAPEYQIKKLRDELRTKKEANLAPREHTELPSYTN